MTSKLHQRARSRCDRGQTRSQRTSWAWSVSLKGWTFGHSWTRLGRSDTWDFDGVGLAGEISFFRAACGAHQAAHSGLSWQFHRWSSSGLGSSAKARPRSSTSEKKHPVTHSLLSFVACQLNCTSIVQSLICLWNWQSWSGWTRSPHSCSLSRQHPYCVSGESPCPRSSTWSCRAPTSTWPRFGCS